MAQQQRLRSVGTIADDAYLESINRLRRQAGPDRTVEELRKAARHRPARRHVRHQSADSVREALLKQDEVKLRWETLDDLGHPCEKCVVEAHVARLAELLQQYSVSAELQTMLAEFDEREVMDEALRAQLISLKAADLTLDEEVDLDAPALQAARRELLLHARILGWSKLAARLEVLEEQMPTAPERERALLDGDEVAETHDLRVEIDGESLEVDEVEALLDDRIAEASMLEPDELEVDELEVDEPEVDEPEIEAEELDPELDEAVGIDEEDPFADVKLDEVMLEDLDFSEWETELDIAAWEEELAADEQEQDQEVELVEDAPLVAPDIELHEELNDAYRDALEDTAVAAVAIDAEAAWIDLTQAPASDFDFSTPAPLLATPIAEVDLPVTNFDVDDLNLVAKENPAMHQFLQTPKGKEAVEQQHRRNRMLADKMQREAETVQNNRLLKVRMAEETRKKLEKESTMRLASMRRREEERKALKPDLSPSRRATVELKTKETAKDDKKTMKVGMCDGCGGGNCATCGVFVDMDAGTEADLAAMEAQRVAAQERGVDADTLAEQQLDAMLG